MARKLIVEIVGDASSLERTFRRSAASAKSWDRDIGRAGRGAITASVGFRGLGRSVAFASGAFLGGAGIVSAIKSTVSAAEESQRVLAQTRVAVERSHESWTKYSKAIRDASAATSKLSGFDDERLLGTFSQLVRRTRDVNEALRLNALAANVARGRNIELEQASQLVLKASIGQAGALRRLGIDAQKGATATQLLALLQQKYAGAAAAYGRTAAGAQDRFRVAIQNLQETIGAGLLPVITRYLNKGADWLNQSKNQQRIARDVGQAVKVLSAAMSVLTNVIAAAAKVFHGFSAAVGGARHAIVLLTGAVVGFKAAGLATSLAGANIQAKGLRSNLLGVGAALAILNDPRFQNAQGRAKGALGPFGFLVDSLPKIIQDEINRGGKLLAGLRGLRSGAMTPEQAAAFVRANADLSFFSGGMGGALGPTTGRFPAPTSRSGGRIPGSITGSAFAPPKTLTAAQTRAIALAQFGGTGGSQEIAAINAQVAADRAAIAFAKKQIAAGKGNVREFGNQLLSLTTDLRQQTDRLTQIAQDRAAKAAAAAKKAQAAAKKARQHMIDTVVAVLATQDPLGVHGGPGVTGGRLSLDTVAKLVAKDQAALASRVQNVLVGRGEGLGVRRGAGLDNGRLSIQQINAEALKRTQAIQFRALGLTATGEALAPTRAALKKELAKTQEALAGTILDTNANRNVLSRIRKVLAGQFGKLTDETKRKVKELLDALNGGDKRGPATRRQAASLAQLTAGTGLTGAGLARLQFNLAGAHLTTPVRGASPTTVHVYVDGREVSARVVANQERTRRRTPTQTRGRVLP